MSEENEAAVRRLMEEAFGQGKTKLVQWERAVPLGIALTRGRLGYRVCLVRYPTVRSGTSLRRLRQEARARAAKG